MVPPTKLLIAMLMFWLFPFLASDILSNISGISLATGAKKNASNIGFTSNVEAACTTLTMKGLENPNINTPPAYTL